MNFGFLRVATAVPVIRMSDCEHNAKVIVEQIKEAEKKSVSLLLFPELSITGVSCNDLFCFPSFCQKAELALEQIKQSTADCTVAFCVGLPRKKGNALYNAMVLIQRGEEKCVFYKETLSLTEKRYFSSPQNYVAPNVSIQETSFSLQFDKPMDFVNADIVLCPSGNYSIVGSETYKKKWIEAISMEKSIAVLYAQTGSGESSTDVVFAGNAMIAECGEILSQSEMFSWQSQLIIADIDIERIHANRLNLCEKQQDENVVEIVVAERKDEDLIREIDENPFIPKGEKWLERMEEIVNLQVQGLFTRLHHVGIKKVVVGISGGLDSTLALLISVLTMEKLGLPRTNVLAITMPGFGTTDRTYSNAVGMIKGLGVTFQEISIKESCIQHFKDINHSEKLFDVVYENSQARERTQILMDIANQQNALVVGTGDLSELVLGWATYNGDQMSMYGVNAGIPKTLVRSLVRYLSSEKIFDNVKEYLLDVVETPVSPELLPFDEEGKIAQKTEDLVGPYELHDFFIFYALRYHFSYDKILFLAKKAFANKYVEEEIIHWLKTFFRRFVQQQYKRNPMPDGPKIGTVGVSPRGDLMFPSDAINVF